jgi:hypothetical protein
VAVIKATNVVVEVPVAAGHRLDGDGDGDGDGDSSAD